jgi:glycosyltransferase involved in cell wall biosynthesis
MHIGIVSPCSSGPLADLLPDSGGVDVGCGAPFMATLVRALIGRGHSVSVITLSRELTHPRIFKGPSLTFYVYPMRMHKRIRDLYKLERQGLRNGIFLAKPDILHAHWTYEFALACLETDLPTVITSHDYAVQVFRYARDLYRLGRLYIQIQVLRNARFLTAVSPYLAESLQWLAKAEIDVIPNPINVPQSPGNGNRPQSDSLRIATVLNGWQNLKNPKAGIKAFNILRRTLPGAEMFMFGADFQERGPAAEWAARNRLSENVYFRGPLPHQELQKELRQMSILLHPALEEACPMALLEAMTAGLPVIAGKKAGGVPWVLDEGRAGYLTNVKNPAAIAETLLTCIKQEDVREQRRQNAYERVRNIFSPEWVVTQYEKTYEKALIS